MDITSFSGDYRFLSNFYHCTVEYDGQLYPSVEHAYQAAKTLDTSKRWAFEFTNVTPGEAKKMGQALVLRPDWEHVKRAVMFNLLISKFKDPKLRQLLLGTLFQHLEEGNTWGDTYWGVCKGRGKNHLGLLLMEVREKISQGLM